MWTVYTDKVTFVKNNKMFHQFEKCLRVDSNIKPVNQLPSWI